MSLFKLIFCFLFSLISLNAQWKLVNPRASLWEVKAIEALSFNRFVAATNGGEIIVTSNGGTNWEKKLQTNSQNWSISFPDKKNGWAVECSSEGKLYNTNDSGDSWLYTGNKFQRAKQVYFFNEKLGFLIQRYDTLGRSPYRVYKTTNAGTIWNMIFDPFKDINIAYAIYDITLSDENNIFIVGDYGLLRSTDQGATWKHDILPLDYDNMYHNIKFYDSLSGLALSKGLEIIKTIDGGNSWIKIRESLDDGTGYRVSDLDLIENSAMFIYQQGSGYQPLEKRTSRIIENHLQNKFKLSSANLLFDGIYFSKDKGLTWTNKPYWNYPYRIALASGIDDSSFVVTGESDIITLTKDYGSSFIPINGRVDFEGIGGLHLFNSKMGFIFSDNGIFQTWDSGETFSKRRMNLPQGHIWVSATMSDSLTIFFTTITGTILKSSDQGNSWKVIPVDVPSGKIIYEARFSSPDIGYFVSENGIFKTVDKGETWLKIYDNASYRISVVDNENIWVTSWGSIIHSSDGGRTWINKGYHEADQLSMLNNKIGITETAYTTNGGDSWNESNLRDLLNGINKIYEIKIFKIKDSIIISYAGALNGELFYSLDTGKTWVKDEFVTPGMLNDAFYKDGSLWFTSSDKGFIIKRDDFNSLTSLIEIKSELSNYSLSQNYPNPFNPSTTIKYSIPERGFVTIKVFDLLGREIRTLINEEKQTGSYEFTFNADGLPSGIYFYSIHAGKFSETRKMLLVK